MARPRRTHAPPPAPAVRGPEAPAGVIAERIEALTEFVSRVGPAVGERRDGDHRADDDCTHPAVLVARDDALVQAYEAIGRLAARA